MPKIKAIISAICGGFAIMLTNPPEIITSNLGKWLELFGITNIPIWIHSQWVHNCLLFLCLSGVWVILAPYITNWLWPKIQTILLIENVADYLTTKSLWSECRYRKFNSKYWSKEEYPLEEIVKKAKLGLIIIKGSRPNTTTVKQIERDYWIYGTLEYSGSYITTSCKDINRRLVFETYNGLQVVFTSRIEDIWPRCSLLDKFYTDIFMWIKIKIYYNLKGKLYLNNKIKP